MSGASVIRRTTAAALGVVIVAASARLFVWPTQDRLSHADAIVVLGGSPNRRPTGTALARAGYANVLAISVGGVQSRSIHIAGVETIEFHPRPASTQGEAEAIATLAAAHGWHRIIVVAGRAQMTRARIRVGRCFKGTVMVVGVRDRLVHLPYDVLYEWGAMAKALIWQRSC